MLAELDCVALTQDVPEHSLAAGDVGAIVHVYEAGQNFLVEFTTFDGQTAALVKLAASQVRPLAANEIHHARALDSTVAAGVF